MRSFVAKEDVLDSFKSIIGGNRFLTRSTVDKLIDRGKKVGIAVNRDYYVCQKYLNKYDTINYLHT